MNDVVEIKVLIADMRGELREKIARLDEKLEAANAETEHFRRNVRTMLTLFATKAEVEAMRSDLEELRDDKKWILRTLVGSWLAWALAALAALFKFKTG